MVEYTYYGEHKAWAKECSTCKELFIGACDQEESEKVFHKIFGYNRYLTDGFNNYCKECARRYRRRRNGIHEEYNESAMFEAQNGRCAICRLELFMPYRFSGDPQGARIDHDHKTGKIRGLLCHPCNAILGMYEALLERNPQFDLYAINAYLMSGQ